MKIQEKLTHLPHMVELLFVLLLAWMVSGWWVSEHLDGRGIAEFEAVHLEGPLSSDVKMLAGIALFGDEKKVRAITKKAPVMPVVQSRLNIKLLGTVVAAERSAAVVMMGGARKQQVFFIGETMQPGVVLDGVEVAAIIVMNHGKSERITLQKSKLGQRGNVVNAPAMARQGRPVQRVLQRSRLQKDMQDLPRLFTQARARPHLNQGRMDGFMVTQIVPGSLYERVGLKNGDIIHKVNGQAVTSASQGMKMYQSLQNTSSIDLELLRNGAIVPIHYEIK